MATLEEKAEVWYQKLIGWVPQWWFEVEDNQVAHFRGMAIVLARMECMLDEHISETFICEATAEFLTEHGNERNVTRQTNEVDFSFSQRIKNITNTTNCPEIKRIVDALLDVGEATILEDFDAGVYFDREHFYNRGDILIDPIYNVYSIIVDKQIHPPYSFFDREYFYDREDFIGTNESSIELFERIVQAVNDSKACGTLYRLIERVG